MARLPVAVERDAGFSPARFGSWVDADHDGCNTRNEVLFNEAKPQPSVLPRCIFVGGRWVSLYDGKTVTSAAAIEVAHQVPIREAWQSGAWKWDVATRKAFMNDLGDSRTLLAATPAAIRARGDKEPQQWLPATGYACDYLASWVAVKWRWHLGVDGAEKAYLGRRLAACGWPRVDNPLRPVIRAAAR